MKYFIILLISFQSYVQAQSCPFGTFVQSSIPELACNKEATVIFYVNGLGERETAPVDMIFNIRTSVRPEHIAVRTQLELII